MAGRIPRAALRREIAKLVSEIATEDRVQLNKLEETALAADLSDDMIGLGPLEPFLDDEEITDILANGPFRHLCRAEWQAGKDCRTVSRCAASRQHRAAHRHRDRPAHRRGEPNG